MKTNLKLLLLSLTTGVAIWGSWPPNHLYFLIFFSFVPLLFILNFSKNEKISTFKILSFTYLSFIVWNGLVCSWIYKVNIFNGLLVNLINPLYQLIPIFLFLLLRKTIKSRLLSYLLFISLWITFEYFHFNWQLAYPFLTLGNVLAMHPEIIQWYEYTGVLGGTLWILTVNIFIYESVKYLFLKKEFKGTFSYIRIISVTLLVAIIPVCISLYIYNSFEAKGREVEVIAIHPNTDCYTEKYLWEPQVLIKRYMELSLKQITPDTEYIVWPETAITSAGLVNTLAIHPDLLSIKEKLAKYPKAKIISGVIIYEIYKGKNKNLPHLKSENNIWFYTYNGAIQLSSSMNYIPLRTKEKLVPFEETVPYPSILSPLKTYITSLGNFSFSTRKTNDNVFKSEEIKSAPVICYESVFGQSTSELVNKGAEILFVMLNEGWYNDRKAASQFMYYSSLRAIENRRSIARSSNRGISCMINQRGDISNIAINLESTAIKSNLKINKEKSFYTRNGDYIGKASFLLFSLITLFVIYKRFL